VIPTKRGGLGEILANTPLLLERLATLTERLTMVLSDQNLKSFENIMRNTDKMTGNLAAASPDVKRVLSELQATLRQANYTLSSFEKLAGSTDAMINDEGSGLAKQLRQTLKSAQSGGRAPGRRWMIRARPRASSTSARCPPPKPPSAICRRPRGRCAK
jgi:phospholipid/cholesterol/gamma-HCH transport system substrate-binding protein